MKVHALAGVWLAAFSLLPAAAVAASAESGRVLFQANCAACHGVPPDHRARHGANNPDFITLAFNAVSGMGQFIGRFTRSEIEDIAAFIGDTSLSENVLTVARSGNGSGSVQSGGSDIRCGGLCAAAFPLGKVVTLAAVPALGSQFSGWLGACSGTATCQLTMSAARTTTAVFTRNGVTIDHTDLWWAGESENGWGMTLTQRAASGQIFSVIYGYDEVGNNTWYVMPGGTWNADYTRLAGGVYRPRGSTLFNYRPDAFVAGAVVGEATLVFSDGNALVLELRIGNARVTKRLVRQPF